MRKSFYRPWEDKESIEQMDGKHSIYRNIKLEKNAVVHRFKNHEDEPYSAIYLANREIWSCQRNKEKFMITKWNKTAKWLFKK